MHILTKVFIVLVSLLSVFMVPLVVVYAHNENNYKARLEAAEAKLAAANQNLQSMASMTGASEAMLTAKIEQLVDQNARTMQDLRESEAAVMKLQSELTDAGAMKVDIASKLAVLSESVKAGQSMTQTLVDELRELRSEVIATRQRNVELDEALRDLTGQLEVAQAARRALQEELARVQEQQAQALMQISEYTARFGSLGESRQASATGLKPDRNLTATVLEVRRDRDQVLVEIDAGSRDGVQNGWIMTVGNGGTFIGNLRIIEVDINRSTGVLTLEDPSRGSVQVGHRAYAIAGR